MPWAREAMVMIEASITRARVQAAHFLEIVHPDRPGGSRVPVQRTVLGSGSMDAARIPPLEKREIS